MMRDHSENRGNLVRDLVAEVAAKNQVESKDCTTPEVNEQRS